MKKRKLTLDLWHPERMSQEVSVDALGDEFKGYVLRIMGGNDKQGFPSQCPLVCYLATPLNQ